MESVVALFSLLIQFSVTGCDCYITIYRDYNICGRSFDSSKSARGSCVHLENSNSYFGLQTGHSHACELSNSMAPMGAKILVTPDGAMCSYVLLAFY